MVGVAVHRSVFTGDGVSLFNDAIWSWKDMFSVGDRVTDGVTESRVLGFVCRSHDWCPGMTVRQVTNASIEAIRRLDRLNSVVGHWSLDDDHIFVTDRSWDSTRVRLDREPTRLLGFGALDATYEASTVCLLPNFCPLISLPRATRSQAHAVHEVRYHAPRRVQAYDAYKYSVCRDAFTLFRATPLHIQGRCVHTANGAALTSANITSRDVEVHVHSEWGLSGVNVACSEQSFRWLEGEITCWSTAVSVNVTHVRFRDTNHEVTIDRELRLQILRLV